MFVDTTKFDKGNKLLLLVDEKNLREYREFLEKNKFLEKVEVMVFGELRPSKELLKSNVYFAADNAQGILDEMEKLKFEHVDLCRSEYVRLSTAKKNRFKFSEQSIGNV